MYIMYSIRMLHHVQHMYSIHMLIMMYMLYSILMLHSIRTLYFGIRCTAGVLYVQDTYAVHAVQLYASIHAVQRVPKCTACTAYLYDIHTYALAPYMLYAVQHTCIRMYIKYVCCSAYSMHTGTSTRTLLPNLLHIYTEKQRSHSREANESRKHIHLHVYV